MSKGFYLTKFEFNAIMLVENFTRAMMIIFPLCHSLDIDMSNEERSRKKVQPDKEYKHRQEMHLDEAALLQNEMKSSETRRLLLALIVIPATILPMCCCLWVCRQIWISRNKPHRHRKHQYENGRHRDGASSYDISQSYTSDLQSTRGTNTESGGWTSYTGTPTSGGRYEDDDFDDDEDY